MTDLTSYDAFVDSQGHTWLVATDQKRYVRRIRPPWNPQGEETPRLVLVAKRPELMDSRHVLPTQEDSALFRNFAAMEPTPEQILDFVHRYGLLWREDRERFEEWEFEIRTMRFLIEIWDAVRARPAKRNHRRTLQGRQSRPCSLPVRRHGSAVLALGMEAAADQRAFRR